MLRISIPPTTPTPITRADFENYHLPIPSNGLSEQGNSDAVLLFNNEDEAVVYADQLEEIVSTVSKTSPLKNILRDLVTTIRNDDSIRNYLENSTIYTWVRNRLTNIRTVLKPSPFLLDNKGL